MDTNKVLEIVRATRDFSLPSFGNVTNVESKSNSYFDVVTDIDRKIENFLKQKLSELDSSINFKGEEFGGDITSRFWLCDPIDGTAHYVRGLPFCTTMLALIEDGTVVFSAVYDFVNDVLYHAVKGQGAFQNGVRMSVSTRSLTEGYLTVESRLRNQADIEKFLKLSGQSCVMATINCGWEFCMVASGKLDGRLGIDPYGLDWDFAPGSLLVSEGGRSCCQHW